MRVQYNVNMGFMSGFGAVIEKVSEQGVGGIG